MNEAAVYKRLQLLEQRIVELETRLKDLESSSNTSQSRLSAVLSQVDESN